LPFAFLLTFMLCPDCGHAPLLNVIKLLHIEVRLKYLLSFFDLL